MNQNNKIKTITIKDVMLKAHLIKHKKQAIDLIDEVLQTDYARTKMRISVFYLLSDLKHGLKTDERVGFKIKEILKREDLCEHD